MTHGGNDGERHRFVIQGAGGSRPTDTPAATAPGVHRDRLRPVSWAVREQAEDLRREIALELHVLAGAPLLFSLAPARAKVLVGQALGLGLLERLLLDEHSLTLVASARAAEADDDRGETAVLACATCERGIARPEEHEVVHVRAGKAVRTSVPHHKQIAALGAAAYAGPVFQRRHRDQVTRTAPLRAASVRELGWAISGGPLMVRS